MLFLSILLISHFGNYFNKRLLACLTTFHQWWRELYNLKLARYKTHP